MPISATFVIPLPIRGALISTILLIGFLIPGQSWAVQPENIRNFTEGLGDQATPFEKTHRLGSSAALRTFYRQNRHQPIWNTGKGRQQNYQQLLRAIETSETHGFNPERYHLKALKDSQTSAFAREILATDAFLTQARHRRIGAVSPQSIDPDWHLKTDEINAVALLEQATMDGNILRHLDGLWPKSGDYRALVSKRAELLAAPSISSVTVPSGAVLKPGQSDPRITLLKARLFGTGDYSPLYDDELLAAVRAFQFSAGLEDDGMVGPATLEWLNVVHFSWIDRIDANLERWRWLPDEIPDTHLRVNIAAFQLRAIRQGEDSLAMKVIVGRPYRRTPVFTETMKYLVYNPYWNVPYSIATKDKLPLLQKDPAALEAQGYEVRPALADSFQSVRSVDWNQVTPRQFTYLLRQKPGPRNALGQIKFMLPNPFSIYLHDTPDHSLFKKQERSFSSGCIRLSDPLGLAEWVLQNDGQRATPDSLRQQLEGGATQTVYLNRPLPVLIVYFTAFADAQNEIIFRRDLYERDTAIVKELRQG